MSMFNTSSFPRMAIETVAKSDDNYGFFIWHRSEGTYGSELVHEEYGYIDEDDAYDGAVSYLDWEYRDTGWRL